MMITTIRQGAVECRVWVGVVSAGQPWVDHNPQSRVAAADSFNPPEKKKRFKTLKEGKVN